MGTYPVLFFAVKKVNNQISSADFILKSVFKTKGIKHIIVRSEGWNKVCDQCSKRRNITSVG
jgi:hypothetical protein